MLSRPHPRSCCIVGLGLGLAGCADRSPGDSDLLAGESGAGGYLWLLLGREGMLMGAEEEEARDA